MALKIIGARQFVSLLSRMGRGALPAMTVAMEQEAEKIMLVSKRDFVPVDLGVLRASGTVHKAVKSANGVSVELGFGGPAAPYALAVHENPRAGKTGGLSPSGKRYQTWATVGQWKYLSTPFRNARRGQSKRIARRMLRMLKSRRRN